MRNNDSLIRISLIRTRLTDLTVLYNYSQNFFFKEILELKNEKYTRLKHFIWYIFGLIINIILGLVTFAEKSVCQK